jgi:hypothetical protein
MATKLCHNLRLFSTNPLWKEIFRGIELKTEATETFFMRTIAYNDGK